MAYTPNPTWVDDVSTLTAAKVQKFDDALVSQDNRITTVESGKANVSHTHGVTDLTATGTRSSTTFLRGDNTWAVPAGGGGGGSTAIGPTIIASAPPSGSGLTAVVGDNSTNETARVQAALDYLSTTYNGGVLDLRMPGHTIKFLSGITIPDKVTLLGDENTVLNFSGIGLSATAVTVNDNDFTPMVNVCMYGPSGDPRDTPNATTDTSIGISVTGVRLRFYGVQVGNFGFGVDLAHDNTFTVSWTGGHITQCRYGIYADSTARAVVENGERFVFADMTLYNCVKGFRITGNNVSFFFTNCAIDFHLLNFGEMEDAYVYFDGTHIETGNTQIASLFRVDKNAHPFFTGCRILMGAGDPNITTALFDTTLAPWDLGFGGARFSNCTLFYVNPSGNGDEQQSEHMVVFPSGATTMTLHTAYPLRWIPVDVSFVSSDFRSLSANNTIRAGWSDASTGNITLTASASAAFDRFVKINFG